MSDGQTPRPVQKRIIRCKNCTAFLFEIEVPLDRPVIGDLAHIRKIKCRKCKFINSVAVTIQDSDTGTESKKVAN